MLADAVFLVAHAPIRAVLRTLSVALIHTTTDRATTPSKTTEADSYKSIVFNDSDWLAWRRSSLCSACIPRLQSSLVFWEFLIQLKRTTDEADNGDKSTLGSSNGGTGEDSPHKKNTAAMYDYDPRFLGLLDWYVLLVGVLALAVRRGDGGVESLQQAVGWMDVGTIKNTLAVMGDRWKAGASYARMLAWLEHG